MAAKREVTRVSQKNLSKAVEKAVGLAARKHKLKLETNLFQREVFHTPWWIVGRRVREKTDLDQAYKAAETITAGVKITGVELQPVAMKVDKDILVGFIERFGGQLEISDLLGGGEL